MKKAITLEIAFAVEPNDQDASAYLQQALENIAPLVIDVKHIEEMETHLLAKIRVKGECAPATPFEGFVLTSIADSLAHTGISIAQSTEVHPNYD